MSVDGTEEKDTKLLHQCLQFPLKHRLIHLMISFVEQRSFLIGKTKATLTHTNIKNFCLRFLVSAAHCLNNWEDYKFLTPWDEYQDIKSRIQVTLRINGQLKEREDQENFRRKYEEFD